ncbi:B3 domain-containing transcription factor VRN1-like, partial [Diospyros lotus]|uniref:B3 domain-containing transcription factor VRN1-like n=1 Tax=Diospyros lotus TaxID=55363 RepID=UPI0022580F8E
NGDVWLCEGWKGFAQYYSIRYGHLLLFRYDGNSHFHVLIFDMSASEIEYPPFDMQIQKREDAGTDDSVDNLEDFPSGRRSRKGKETVEHVSTANFDACPRSQTRKPASYPTDKEEWINGDTAQRSQQSQISHKPLETRSMKLTALQRVTNFQSSNPFFEVYMRPSYVNEGRLSIPTDFSRKYLSGKEKSVLLQVSDGRAWSAKCSWRKISGPSFVRDNNLQVGDVCIFELVVRGLEPRFNVIVSRRGESQSPLPLPLPLMKGKALGVKVCGGTDAFKEAIWLQGILKEIHLLQSKVVVFSDSQSAIHLSKNPVYHDRTKHVDVKYHYVREMIANGTVGIQKVSTANNPADMGTKVLTATKLKHCLNLLHIDDG